MIYRNYCTWKKHLNKFLNNSKDRNNFQEHLFSQRKSVKKLMQTDSRLLERLSSFFLIGLRKNETVLYRYFSLKNN